METCLWDMHQAADYRLVYHFIHHFLLPMKFPLCRSRKPLSEDLWISSFRDSTIPLKCCCRHPQDHQALDCREPHPPLPSSHEPPQGRIPQATKLWIVENLIHPFLSPSWSRVWHHPRRPCDHRILVSPLCSHAWRHHQGCHC